MENERKKQLVELSVNRLRAEHFGDAVKVAYYTARMGEIITEDIELQKRFANKGCKYKDYILNNEGKIREKCAVNITVVDHDQAVKVIRQQDFRKILNLKFALKEVFDCDLFQDTGTVEGLGHSEIEANSEATEELRILNEEGNDILDYRVERNICSMWTYSIVYREGKKKVYVNMVNGDYKLFFYGKSTKDNKTLKSVFEESYDLINLIEVIFNIETYTAINMICNLLNIRVQYVDDQRLKYSSNKALIEDKKYIESKHLSLHKYIGKHLYLLEELLEEGEKNITTVRNSFQGENIFFCSGAYMEGKLKILGENWRNVKSIKQTQVCKLINTFCVLGFLIKVSKENVPSRLRKIVEGKKEINYYIVTKYTEELLIQAEARVKILKHGRSISATNMTEADCRGKFGDTMGDMVYGKSEVKKDSIIKSDSHRAS